MQQISFFATMEAETIKADAEITKAIDFIISRRKCQVCGVKGKSPGINSNLNLTICEDCDRRNNPYYYRATTA